MKDLGPLSYFLEIVWQDMHVAYCNPFITPIDTKLKLIIAFDKPYEDHTMYQSLVGAL